MELKILKNHLFCYTQKYGMDSKKSKIESMMFGIRTSGHTVIRVSLNWEDHLNIFINKFNNTTAAYPFNFITAYHDEGTGKYRINSDIVYKGKSLYKRVKNRKQIKELRNKYEKLAKHAYLVCNDPMNGCPEDFAEGYNRELRSIEYQIDKLL